MAMDDAGLVGLARAGDKAAFAVLLGRHRPMLLALCRRALGDPGLAEDAAQEAALQAMLALDRLERPERFGAWLAGIGLNLCRRWRRERTRESWSLEAVLGGRTDGGPPPPAGGPAEAAEMAEAAELVRRAVGGLPPGQRAAVVLFYLAGLTHREVAATLGIGVGAVKTRLHKGRAALRELLAGPEEDAMTETQTTRGGLVELRVADVRRKPATGEDPEKPAVLLEEVGGTRKLCIWVGPFEATSIALTHQAVPLPRPMVYQFAAGLLGAAGGRLVEVRVTRLAEGVFYAVAVVEGPAGTREVDARPSDALNLALLVGAPILAEVAVLAEVAAEPDLLGEVAGYPDGLAEIVAETRAGWAEVEAALTRSLASRAAKQPPDAP
jgi:RNA polymerase sigma factor (sigma-70 family)